MYDIDFIQRIFHLTCSEADLRVSHSEIRYDITHPFMKYYRYSQIKRAFEAYLNGIWSDKMLARWACHYLWILLGGCDYDHVIEDLNSMQSLCRDLITDALDGLAFFEEEIADDPRVEIGEMLCVFESLDRVFRTQQQWRAVYAPVGSNAIDNGTQYVVLINDTQKEYMIADSDHLVNGFEDERFDYVDEAELLDLVNTLKADGYRTLPCSEEDFYLEIED